MSLTSPLVRLRILPALLPVDGINADIRVSPDGLYIQKQIGMGAWENLIALSELQGPIGPETELRSNGSYVQWRPNGASNTAWRDLFALSEIGGGGGSGGGGAVAFADITGKPTTLGGYGITDAASQSALTSGLAGKANTSHTHPISAITNLQAALDGKAASAHTHPISNVTGLQAALDGKSPLGHIHSITDVTGLSAALAAKESTANKGQPNGYASLASDGLLDPAQVRGGGVSPRTFTPEQYGAVGDNVADDYAAFVSLFAAVKAAGGGRIIAAGNYRLSQQLSINGVNNWVLDGQKTGAFYSPGAATAQTGKQSNGHAFRLENCARVVIRDLYVAIPRAKLRGTGMCFRIVDSSHILMDNVQTDGGTCGIWFFTCQHCTVRNCHIDTPKADGIHFGHGSAYCRAIGNIVLNAGDDSFSTTYYSGYPRPREIEFIGNTAVGGVWGAGINVWSGDNCLVSGNILRDLAGPGVSLSEHDGGGPCNNCSVVGNRIFNCGLVQTQPNSYWDGTPVANDPPATGPSVNCGICVCANRSLVGDNSVNNGTTQGESNGSFKRYGIYVHGASSLISVKGNQFGNIDGEGVLIETDNVGYITVDGNSFDQVYGSAVAQFGANQYGNRIVQNVFGNGANRSDAGGAIVRLANLGSTPYPVTGNCSAVTGSSWLSSANSPGVMAYFNVFAGMPDPSEISLPANPTFDTISLRPGGDPNNGASGTTGKLFAGPSGNLRVYTPEGQQAKYILSEFR